MVSGSREHSQATSMRLAMMNLAHVLGFSVVAEGVETQQQHDEISAGGCEFAQGYFGAATITAPQISADLGSLHGRD